MFSSSKNAQILNYLSIILHTNSALCIFKPYDSYYLKIFSSVYKTQRKIQCTSCMEQFLGFFLSILELNISSPHLLLLKRAARTLKISSNFFRNRTNQMGSDDIRVSQFYFESFTFQPVFILQVRYPFKFSLCISKTLQVRTSNLIIRLSLWNQNECSFSDFSLVGAQYNKSATYSKNKVVMCLKRAEVQLQRKMWPFTPSGFR